jgi:hypothetical protein
MSNIIPPALMQLIPLPFVAGALASVGYLARHFLSSPLPPAGPALLLTVAKGAKQFDPALLMPVALATVGSVALYYAFLFTQAFSTLNAHAAKATKASKDGQTVSLGSVKYGPPSLVMRTFERSVGNFMEQYPPLLLALWLYALFVDAAGAATFAWAWVGLRAIYPAAFYASAVADFLPIIFVSTLPSYLAIFYMLCSVARVALRAA